jgi:hypothetical protein
VVVRSRKLCESNATIQEQPWIETCETRTGSERRLEYSRTDGVDPDPARTKVPRHWEGLPR